MVGINSRVWQLQYNICCRVSRPFGLAIGLLVQFRILHTTERNEINNTQSHLNLRTFRVGNFRTSNQIKTPYKTCTPNLRTWESKLKFPTAHVSSDLSSVALCQAGPLPKPPITKPLLSALHDTLHTSNFTKMLTASPNRKS
jgi:hypothetical protein